MKKAYRVKKDQDFQRVFHQGRSVANRQLVLYVYPKPGQAHYRVGLSVGKKLGNAVERNFIKRRLRSAVQAIGPAIQPEFDFLLIARQDIKNKTYPQLQKSIIHVMNLMNILDQEILANLQGGRHDKTKNE